MLKGKPINIFFIFIILFCLNLHFPLHAEDSCDDAIVAPTVPGDYIILLGWYCECDPNVPIEFDPNNPKEITCGTDITIIVIGGCSPIEWEVKGNGYILETTEDERICTLSCSGGT